MFKIEPLICIIVLVSGCPKLQIMVKVTGIFLLLEEKVPKAVEVKKWH